MIKSALKKQLISIGIYDFETVRKEVYEKTDPEFRTEDNGIYCIINTHGITDDEITTILLAKQTGYLKTIKNILAFFFILFLIFVIGYIIIFTVASL